MPMYELAGLAVDIRPRFDFIINQCAEYRKDAPAADFEVRVSKDEIEKERKMSGAGFSEGYLESVCAYRQICERLPEYGAILLHGSVIECGGRGIAFVAPSGTGKTTHTLLWKKLYGAVVINGDKPIVRFENGAPYAYGTPWAGKENMQKNARVGLTDICFIKRSFVNKTRPVPADAAALLRQLYIPRGAENAVRALELADRLINTCSLWTVECDMSDNAAKAARRAIFGSN